jgi:membrane associated rhomboid family serine protease
MFALALFGSMLERVIGGKRFLFVFFASGIAAGIGSALFYTASLGASGAVYGIMGTLAILRPKMTVYTGYGVPMPLILTVVFWSLGDFLGIFYPCRQIAGEVICENVAYAAHLAGLAFGIVYGFSLRKKFAQKTHKRKREKYEISEKDFEDWENRWMVI